MTPTPSSSLLLLSGTVHAWGEVKQLNQRRRQSHQERIPGYQPKAALVHMVLKSGRAPSSGPTSQEALASFPRSHSLLQPRSIARLLPFPSLCLRTASPDSLYRTGATTQLGPWIKPPSLLAQAHTTPASIALHLPATRPHYFPPHTRPHQRRPSSLTPLPSPSSQTSPPACPPPHGPPSG